MTKAKTISNKKSGGLFYLAVIAGMAAILAIVGYAGLGDAASPNPYEGVEVRKNGNTYSAYFFEDQNDPDEPVLGSSVQRWKYVVRDDELCNGSHFSDGGAAEGNIGSVIHGSDSFTLTLEQFIEYDTQFICFNALLTDGSWAQGGRQILIEPGDLLYGVYTRTYEARNQLRNMRLDIDLRTYCSTETSEGECIAGGTEIHYDCTDGASKLAAWPADILAAEEQLHWSQWQNEVNLSRRSNHGIRDNQWSAVRDYVGLAKRDVADVRQTVYNAIDNYKEHCGLS